MRLFADTSDPDLIRSLYDKKIILGITTNPTTAAEYLKKRYRWNVHDLISEIVQQVGPLPISVEVIGCVAPYRVCDISVDRLRKEGETILGWDKKISNANLWIKMPTIPQGLETAYKLIGDFGERVRINSTLGFDYMQAIHAAEAGAYVFSLFMGRMQAMGEDPIPVAIKIITEYRRRNLRTGFLAASMRTPELIIASWKAGADIATAPPNVLEDLVRKYPKEFEEMRQNHPEKRTCALHILPESYDEKEFEHPLLQLGLERFVSDAKSVGYNLLEETMPDQ